MKAGGGEGTVEDGDGEWDTVLRQGSMSFLSLYPEASLRPGTVSVQ